MEELPSSIFGVLVPFQPAPMFFSDALEVPDLSEDDIRLLSQDLDFEISRETRLDLDRLIQRFVCTVALAGRLPTWKNYIGHLERIRDSARTFNEAQHRLRGLVLWSNEDDATDSKVLSAPQAIKTFIGLADWGPEVKKRAVRKALSRAGGLDELIGLCEDEIARLRPLKAKRGRKPDQHVNFLLQALTRLTLDAGLRPTLPSRGQMGELAADCATPFFRFCRSFLTIAIEKGIAAVESSDLSPREKAAAARTFRFSGKSNDSLLDHLYNARKLVKAAQIELIDRPTD
jgi:hypothetical protein